MKKNIFAPNVRIIRFNSDDIIVTSPTLNESKGFEDDIKLGGLAPERYNPNIWD